MALIPGLTFTDFRVVSMDNLQRVWLASMERLPFRTPTSVPPFGDLLMLQLLRTSFTERAVSFLDFSP